MIPKQVKYIIRTLINNGYECYLVGGSVRDILLNRTPKDYDLTTNAHPNIVESLFEKTIPTGKDYGTITVMIDGESYEVTTYRLECDYDGRRPKIIKFAENLKEDLARRDFTINAMAMDIEGNIIDYFGGQNDLKNKIIRCVGEPKERFKEDKLRMIRAIRFATRYGFNIHNKTYNNIHSYMPEVSKERLRDELNKILLCEKPSIGIKMIMEKGLWSPYTFGMLFKCKGFIQNNPHHDKDIFDHIMSVLDNVEPKLELRLSALFHDIGKPNTYTEDNNGIGHFYEHHKESAKICRDIMTRLRYSKKEIEYVSELVYWHMSKLNTFKSKTVKKFINNVGVDKLKDLFKLQIADISGSQPPYDYELVYKLKFKCEEILSTVSPMSIKDLKVDGYDLIKLGFEGKEIGECLKYLLECVLEDESKNEQFALLELIRKYKDYKN